MIKSQLAIEYIASRIGAAVPRQSNTGCYPFHSNAGLRFSRKAAMPSFRSPAS